MIRITLSAWLMLVAGVSAAESLKVTIEAGKVARENSLVSVPVKVSAKQAKQAVTLVDADGKKLPGQITAASLTAREADPNQAELHFLVPQLAAGKAATYTVTFQDGKDQSGPAGAVFQWVDTSRDKADSAVYAEQSKELRLGDRPVLRYMYSKLDESTKDARSATFKPYHHVYDPAGKRFVTKGPGGLFPHHRGLFFGFNKISYGPDGKQQADVWHCNNGEYQEHVEFLSEEVGPVLGRQRVKINWRGRDKQVFAVEERELTAYNTPDGVLIEFASKLENATEHPVKLDGDPQHAGFQFRGAQDIPDKTAKQTYYLRPDGKGEPGKFRNWPGDKQHVNLPWNALSFVLDDQRYTCCYLDRPENPKESRFSERDYGRFGSYFEYPLNQDNPLNVNYRIWLQAGEMTVDEVQQLDDDFVQPIVAKVE